MVGDWKTSGRRPKNAGLAKPSFSACRDERAATGTDRLRQKPIVTLNPTATRSGTLVVDVVRGKRRACVRAISRLRRQQSFPFFRVDLLSRVPRFSFVFRCVFFFLRFLLNITNIKKWSRYNKIIAPKYYLDKDEYNLNEDNLVKYII